MPKIDLEAMSLQDLKTLQNDVGAAISSFEARKRKDAMAAAEAAAREHGFSLADLAGGKGKVKAKAAQPAKYAHPENASVTWSGRGRQPGWIRDAIAAGTDLAEYLIDKVKPAKSGGKKKAA